MSKKVMEKGQSLVELGVVFLIVLVALVLASGVVMSFLTMVFSWLVGLVGFEGASLLALVLFLLFVLFAMLFLN